MRHIYSRRKPSQSEITINEIKNLTANDLYNKIRSLQDPYPNAFIKDKNGNKLFIVSAYTDKKNEKNSNNHCKEWK